MSDIASNFMSDKASNRQLIWLHVILIPIQKKKKNELKVVETLQISFDFF